MNHMAVPKQGRQALFVIIAAITLASTMGGKTGIPAFSPLHSRRIAPVTSSTKLSVMLSPEKHWWGTTLPALRPSFLIPQKSVVGHRQEPARRYMTKDKNPNKQKFLLHRGQSASIIKRSPSIGGVGLCKGWTPEATEAFTKAVQELVKLNPILTGHAYETRWKTGRRELRIQAGTFPLESHKFVNVINAEDLSIDFDAMDPMEVSEVVAKECLPLLEESELVSNLIKKKQPLFHATVILLPQNHAAYSMSMSHALGDGVTFFMLLKQLSLLMSGLDVRERPINWSHPRKATHELFPTDFTQRDISLMYGFSMMVGALKNVVKSVMTKEYPRKVDILLLNKNKVNQKKRELRAELEECKDVSANDIITAAICQSNQSSDMFIFTENARGDISGIDHNSAGNFLTEVPISRELASEPCKIRTAVKESHGNGGCTNNKSGLPAKPFLEGRVGRITSLATIPANLIYDGTEQICTLPYLSFLEKIPLDVAMIFRYDKENWGVIHNFAEFKPTELLHELID